MPKLSVHFVTWNSEQYVPLLFDSLRKQTYTDWQLLVWDNASSDGIVSAIKKEVNNFPVHVEIVESKENLGFAGGHNKLWQKSDAEYVLWLNPDMYLLPDCFERLVQFLDECQEAAAVSARLMRWHFTQAEVDLQKSFSNTIDSLGLQIFRNRRVVEKATGKQWHEVEYSNEPLEVFGLPGTFPMFKKRVLDKICFDDGTLLDELYGSYKEDVDLAYRMQWRGLKSYVLTDVVAYHARATGGPEGMSDWAAHKNKRTEHSSWVKYHSYKNHLMTLCKNLSWKNFFLDFIPIKWYEAKKFWYFVLCDRKPLKGLREIRTHWKELKSKRLQIMTKRTVASRQLRRWWS